MFFILVLFYCYYRLVSFQIEIGEESSAVVFDSKVRRVFADKNFLIGSLSSYRKTNEIYVLFYVLCVVL